MNISNNEYNSKLAPIHNIGRRRVVIRDDEVLRISSSKKILHIGCADFPYTLMQGDNLLHKKLSEVTDINNLWGLDISEKGCKLLREMGFNNIFTGNIEKFSSEFKSQSFDIILAGEVIEHVANPGSFLASLASIMTTKTELLLTTVNVSSLKTFIFAMLRKEKVHPDHNFYFSYWTLKHLLEKCFLDPFEIYYYAVKYTNIDKLLSLFTFVSPVVSDGIIARATRKT